MTSRFETCLSSLLSSSISRFQSKATMFLYHELLRGKLAKQASQINADENKPPVIMSRLSLNPSDIVAYVSLEN